MAYARLCLNIRLNGFKNIIAYPVALAEREGIARLSWSKKNSISTNATLARADLNGWENVPVDVKPFDSLGIDLGQRGIVKIDVEGAEMPVLAGMAEAFAHRPDIILETLNAVVSQMIDERFVKPNSYRVFKIDEAAMTLNETPRLTKGDAASQNYNSFITVRDVPTLNPAPMVEAHR
jgi:FkbM family methyltransferase